VAALVFVLIVVAMWASAHYLQPAPPRHIVLASGLEDGLPHRYAKRYIEILARAGVTVEERMTRGAGENLLLLQDPHSGVDVAFTQGGVARSSESDNVVMLASLYYVPLWIFYSGNETLTQINQLIYRRVAIGVEGSGARAFAEPLFALNGLTTGVITLPMSNNAALHALQSGEVNAAIFVDGARNDAVWTALHDPKLKLNELRARRRLSSSIPVHHKSHIAARSNRFCAKHSENAGRADSHKGNAGEPRWPAPCAGCASGRCSARDSRRIGLF
jgi:TRAP-type uncharacterized transport system substrate-binding protein